MQRIIDILKSYRIFKKLIIGLSLMIAVFIIGTSGFMIVENYSLLDAMYMTIITVASVGFNEVHPLSNHGKIFTSCLIILSVSSYAYAITVITSWIIEGEFQTHFKHYRVNKEIKKLTNHVIVCGYGRNGRQACEQLSSGNKDFVVIESNPQIVEQLNNDEKILFVEGNATNDDVLVSAGIETAHALITTLPDDANNVFVVLTARGMNPKMKIISRASDDHAEIKLKRAGADNVIMPDKIGGTHMAALITKPDVLEFVDYITGKINIRLEEIPYHKLPEKYRNKTISEIEIRKKTGANVIGFKVGNSEYMINPPPETVMIPDAKLFVLGTTEQVVKLFEILKS